MVTPWRLSWRNTRAGTRRRCFAPSSLITVTVCKLYLNERFRLFLACETLLPLCATKGNFSANDIEVVLYQQLPQRANQLCQSGLDRLTYNESMLNLLLTNPIAGLIFIVGLVISVTIHEFAHAWAADHLGDPTPRYQGRVTLNPLAHLDPVGSIALLLTGFGWGRPVEFDPYNLENQLKDTALIALAGPLSNLLLAGLLSLVLRLEVIPFAWLSIATLQIVVINVSLAIFNLLPIRPLDGSKIILAVLPREAAYEYESLMERMGIVLLIFIIFPWIGGASLASQIISPIINLVLTLLVGVSVF